jgi:molecular chaperone GrpE
MSDEPKMTPPQVPGAEAAARTAAEQDMEASLDHDPGQIPPQQMRGIIDALQAELDQLHARVAAKDAQLEAANDKVLRTYADLDNMRKRVEREKEETAKYAITKFARDVVNVADNFERAILSVPAEAKADNPALVALIDGVSLTEREFLNVLERHGVKRVAPQGEAFNPHHHQAVMETQNLDVPPGTVLQVFQPGYLIDDRVLRPAMVVVAAGGAKTAKAQAKPSDDDDEAA